MDTRAAGREVLGRLKLNSSAARRGRYRRHRGGRGERVHAGVEVGAVGNLFHGHFTVPLTMRLPDRRLTPSLIPVMRGTKDRRHDAHPAGGAERGAVMGGFDHHQAGAQVLRKHGVDLGDAVGGWRADVSEAQGRPSR